MTTYQIYDFIKDVNYHIKTKNPIDLHEKSEAFKQYLFKLKLFQLTVRIKKSHPIFGETYFLFILSNVVYVAKKLDTETLNFDYVEISNGIRLIRLMKLKKLFR